MKKMLFLAVLAIGIIFTAIQARSLGKQEVPAAVLTAFKQKFPQAAEVEWKKEKDGNWEAEFEMGEKESEMSATFDPSGKWLETETEISIADLPVAVKAAVQGKKVKEASKIMRTDGSTVYEAEVKGKDLLFDANGKTVN